jgi:hypothetical protein
MALDPNEVVKVYSGSYVAAEAYQNALEEAGIESKVVGDSLLAGLGSAIPNSIEIWVHQKDAEKALAAITRYEDERTRAEQHRQQHPHPTSDPKPGHGPSRKEPHVKQDPLGE